MLLIYVNIQQLNCELWLIYLQIQVFNPLQLNSAVTCDLYQYCDAPFFNVMVYERHMWSDMVY